MFQLVAIYAAETNKKLLAANQQYLLSLGVLKQEDEIKVDVDSLKCYLK